MGFVLKMMGFVLKLILGVGRCGRGVVAAARAWAVVVYFNCKLPLFLQLGRWWWAGVCSACSPLPFRARQLCRDFLVRAVGNVDGAVSHDCLLQGVLRIAYVDISMVVHADVCSGLWWGVTGFHRGRRRDVALLPLADGILGSSPHVCWQVSELAQAGEQVQDLLFALTWGTVYV